MTEVARVAGVIDDRSRRIAFVTIDVTAYQTLDILVVMKGLATTKVDRPAVVAYRFRGEDSNIVNDPCKSHPYSSILGARYEYVTQANLTEPLIVREVVVPEGATKLEACVLSWQNTVPTSLQASVDVKMTLPTADALKRAFQNDRGAASSLALAVLAIPSSSIKIDSLLAVFEMVWKYNDFRSSWLVGQKLLFLSRERRARATHIEVARRLDSLAEISAANNTVGDYRSRVRISRNNADPFCLRLISSQKHALDHIDLIAEKHLPPAEGFSTIFVSPIDSAPVFDTPSIWKDSSVLEQPWWIQAGLSQPFIDRASRTLLHEYACSVTLARLAGCRYSLVHAGLGRRGYELGAIGLALAAAYRVPLIFEFDSSAFSPENSSPGSFPHERLISALSICGIAEKVIANRPEDVAFLEKNKVGTDKVVLITNSTDGRAESRLAEIYKEVGRPRRKKKV